MALRQRLILDVSQHRQALRQAQEDLKRFSRESRKHGTDVGDGVTRGAQEAARAWERSGSRIERTLARLKDLVLAVFAVNTIRRFIGALVDASASMQNLEASFVSAAGGAREARAVLAQIEDLSRRTPQRFQELAAAGRQLLNTGVASNDDLVARLQALSDAASALNPGEVDQTVNRIALALGQMQTKGKVSAEEMLQLTEAGVPAWQLLAAAVGKTTAEVQAMTQKGLIPANEAVDHLIRGLGERFAGSAERAARTFTGRMAAIRDEIDRILRDAGGLLFAELSADVGSFADSLSRLRESRSFRETIQSIAESLRDLYDVVKLLAPLLAQLKPHVVRFGLAFGAIRLGQGVITGFQQLKAAWDAAGKSLGSFADKWHAFRMEQVRAARTRVDGPDFLTDATKSAGEVSARTIELSKAQQRALRSTRGLTGALRRMGTTARSALGQLGRMAVALLGWPAIIAAVATALYAVLDRLGAFSRRLDETTRKARDAAYAVRSLTQSLEDLRGSSLGAAAIELQFEIPDLGKLASDALAEVPTEHRVKLEAMGADELAQVAQDALRLAQSGFLTNWDGGPTRRLREAFGMDPQDIRLPFDRDTAETIARAAEALGTARSAGERLNEVLRDNGDNLAFQIGQLEALMARMEQDLGTSAFSSEHYQALAKELEELQKRRAALLGIETTVTVSGESRRDAMTLEEIKRQTHLLALAEELRSKQEEIYRLQDQAKTVEQELATATGQRRTYLEALLAALRQEIEAKNASLAADTRAYTVAQEQARLEAEREALWASLPAHVQAAVGSMEEMADLLRHIDMEALGVDAAAFLGEIEGATRRLNEKLEDIQDRLTAGLIDESQARKEAEAVRDEYLRVFQDLLTRLQPLLDRLPQGVADALKAALRELRSAVESADTGGPDWSKQLREVEAYTNGVIDLAHAFGMLDDEAASALRSVANLGVGIGRIASGDVAGGVTQAVSGLVGIISGMGKDHAEIKRLSDSIRRNVRALEDNTRALMGSAQIGADLTREQVEAAEQAITRMEQAARAGSMRGFTRGLQALEESGIPGTERLTDLFTEAFNLMVEKDGRIAAVESLDDLMQAFVTGDFSNLPRYVQELFVGFDGLREMIDELNANLGAYSDTVAGAVERSRDRQQFLGLEGQEAFEDFFAGIGDGLEDAMSAELKAILAEMRGLDLSTAEGRRRFEELVALAYGLGVSGDAGISADDVEAMLSHLQSIADSITDPRSETSRTVQSVRQITEYQGDVIVGVLRESLHVLRGIHRAVAGVGVTVPHIPDPSAASTRALQGADRAVRASTSQSVSVTNDVDIAIHGINVATVDDLLREIDRRVRNNPRLR